MGWFNPFLGGSSGGGGGGEGNTTTIAKTTAQWNATPTLVSQPNTIYVYTDYDNQGGVDIPGIKIGDGNAYVIDLPFIAGTSITITQEQINYWNNKVSMHIDPTNNQNLIFENN